VRAGAPTPASDPVDVGVVAYLLRPDGWQATVADANRRWMDEQAGGAAAPDELAALRREVAELRSRSRSEPARVKEAVAAATKDHAAQVRELRAELRKRTAELRAAERARDEAQAQLAAAADAAEAADAAREAELRRLRSRITELERASGSARREAKAERDVDDARLWLLVETLREAAAGIRRELALAPPSLRPADSLDGGSQAAPVRRLEDPQDVDRLLAVPNVHLVVDGYNVTKTGYPELALADQRARLIAALAPLAARTGAEVTIAFDGSDARPPAQPRVPRGVRVLFSAAGETADDLIRRLVAAEPPGRPLVVVTSDQQIVTDVLAAGAWTVPSDVLLARLR
jgi:predicted RNA-binding protein with PIN domain